MAETPQPHPRPVLDSPTNKDNKNGFVVFKSNNPQNKPLPQKSESAKESERKYSKPNLQRPHSSARGSEANTANPKRGKPTIEVATSNKKAVPQTNNFHTPKANTNFRTEKVFETAGKSSAAKSTAKEENRINVNLKKPSKGYASNHRDSSTSKNESSNKTSQREYDQQQQQQLYQQYEEEYRQNQMYLQKFAHQQLQEQAQYQNPYQIPYQNSGKIEKNQEILYEIQNIDQEIQM